MVLTIISGVGVSYDRIIGNAVFDGAEKKVCPDGEVRAHEGRGSYVS